MWRTRYIQRSVAVPPLKVQVATVIWTVWGWLKENSRPKRHTNKRRVFFGSSKNINKNDKYEAERDQRTSLQGRVISLSINNDNSSIGSNDEPHLTDRTLVWDNIVKPVAKANVIPLIQLLWKHMVKRLWSIYCNELSCHFVAGGKKSAVSVALVNKNSRALKWCFFSENQCLQFSIALIEWVTFIQILKLFVRSHVCKWERS